MTDKDAQVLRNLLDKEGWDGVLGELIKIARSYARRGSNRWFFIKRELMTAQLFFRRSERDFDNFDRDSY